MAKVSNSSKSSNLCWFSDKPQHLVLLAWDAACTIGCCKLFAWSGPGTPHVMGNSLNSAHLGRHCRLDPPHLPLLQPASHCCSHLPLTQQPLYLAAAHSHSSPTLGPWPARPHLSSCPRVCGARRETKEPAYLPAERRFGRLLGPNSSPRHRQQPRARPPVRWEADYRPTPRSSPRARPLSLNACPPGTPPSISRSLVVRRWEPSLAGLHLFFLRWGVHKFSRSSFIGGLFILV